MHHRIVNDSILLDLLGFLKMDSTSTPHFILSTRNYRTRAHGT